MYISGFLLTLGVRKPFGFSPRPIACTLRLRMLFRLMPAERRTRGESCGESTRRLRPQMKLGCTL